MQWEEANYNHTQIYGPILQSFEQNNRNSKYFIFYFFIFIFKQSLHRKRGLNPQPGDQEFHVPPTEPAGPPKYFRLYHSIHRKNKNRQN